MVNHEEKEIYIRRIEEEKKKQEKINRGIRLGKEYIQNGNGGNCEEITKSLLRKNRKEQKK